MKRYVAPSICYALAFVLWLLSIYCENYALSLADLKTLTGDDVEGAIKVVELWICLVYRILFCHRDR
jgi:hypothetical protein